MTLPLNIMVTHPILWYYDHKMHDALVESSIFTMNGVICDNTRSVHRYVP